MDVGLGRTARPGPETLRLTGLQHPVTVSFSTQGVPSIQAATDHDAYLALGYVQARFRLSEMDSERRLGEGRLAQLAGPSELASDRFELRLGLLRTAQREWAATPRSSPAGQALLSYAQGINDDIAQVRAQGDWPAEFSLTRVYPSAWTPVDSLVVQGVLTQELDFTTTPLDYALLEKSLGRARTMAWFPVNPPNQQSPFDPGPYRDLGLTQVPADLASSAPVAEAGTDAEATAPTFHTKFGGGHHGGGSAAYGDQPAAGRGDPPAAGQQRLGGQRARGRRERRRCWPATRTCRRPCRPSGTRRPSRRPA